MQYNSIVKDYMDDWTQRTANAACISFTKPSRQGMMLLCTDPQLKTVTENIAETSADINDTQHCTAPCLPSADPEYLREHCGGHTDPGK